MGKNQKPAVSSQFSPISPSSRRKRAMLFYREEKKHSLPGSQVSSGTITVNVDSSHFVYK